MIRREAIRQQKIALPSDDEIRSWRCPRGTDFKRQMTSALYEHSLDRIDVLDRGVQGKDKTKSPPAGPPTLHTHSSSVCAATSGRRC